MKDKVLPYRFFNRFTHRVKLKSLSLHFFSILKSFITLPIKQMTFCGVNCGCSSKTTGRSAFQSNTVWLRKFLKC